MKTNINHFLLEPADASNQASRHPCFLRVTVNMLLPQQQEAIPAN